MHSKTNNSQKIKFSKTQSAFTIVELLVVIVIIGILAAIIFLAYTGISQKAIDTSLQSDLKNASTILELDKSNDDFYPSTSGSANNNKGLKASSDTILNYAYNIADNSYCLTATKNGRSYYINSADRTPKQGSCPDGSITSSFTRTWGGSGNETGYSVIQTNDGGIPLLDQPKATGLEVLTCLSPNTPLLVICHGVKPGVVQALIMADK